MNLAPFPITLFAGMKIGQISFIQMTSPVDVPYGHGDLSSKYQGDIGPTPSRYHLELSDWPRSAPRVGTGWPRTDGWRTASIARVPGAPPKGSPVPANLRFPCRAPGAGA